VGRAQGPSVRLRLAASYAVVVVVTGVVLLVVVWLFLLRYVPAEPVQTQAGFVPTRDDLVRAFAPAAASVLVGLLVVGSVGGWLLAGRVLAPLERLTEAARRATSGSLSHRVDLTGRDDEFRVLADAFDAMLARVEAQVAAQQRFAANASHELRTPLAVTRTLLDVARDDPAHDPVVLLDRLRAVNARAVDLTEALLLLSRADQGAFAREPVDLSLMADEAVETLVPLADARGVRLEVSGAVATTHGSRALLLQLVTNLVHNAIVHNVAPGGRAGLVRVSTASRADAAVLVVENGGQEVRADLVATLTEPFQRGGARLRGVEGGHDGSGLGLAIVDAIVRAHSGALVLTPRHGGGLRVEVRLPRSAPAQE